MVGGGDAARSPSHLLECSPQADPEVSEYLRAAPRRATAARRRAAAAYLERALEERAPGDDRGGMLAALSTVAFDAGLPDSRRRLLEALREVARRSAGVDVLTRLAALTSSTPTSRAVAALRARAGDETDPRRRLAIEARRWTR